MESSSLEYTGPQLSPSQTPLPESRQKLRLSCDSCAAAKVKCNKVHPCCGRCKGASTLCVYGISRKHGKSSLKSQRGHCRRKSEQRALLPGDRVTSILHDLSKPELQKLLRELSSEANDQRQVTSNYSDGSQLSWAELPPSPFSSVNEAPSLLDHLPPRPTESLETGYIHSMHDREEMVAPQPMVSQGGIEPANGAVLDFHGPSSPNATALNSTPFGWTPQLSDISRPVDWLGQMLAQGSRNNPDHPKPHSCYTLASHTLKSLQLPSNTSGIPITYVKGSCSTISPSSSTNAPMPPIPSLDRVLGANKLAVANMLQLLSCTCACNPRFAMLYASIIAQVLFWYQAVGPDVNPTLHGRTSAAMRSPSVTSDLRMGSAGPGIARPPIKIGNFDVDEEDQEVLRRQVLLSELRKTEHAIDRLASIGSRTSGDANGLTSNLYAMLGAWLKAELARTIREVKGEHDCES